MNQHEILHDSRIGEGDLDLLRDILSQNINTSFRSVYLRFVD